MLRIREIGLDEGNASRKRFNFSLSLTRRLFRRMIMEDEVESLLRKSQRKCFSQPMCCACDEGERSHESIISGVSGQTYADDDYFRVSSGPCMGTQMNADSR